MDDHWILQLCHGYSGPFLDVARQYAALFKGSPFKVLTVYLTGKPDEQARAGSASDEVIFLNYSSRAIRGLKIDAIRKIQRIAASRDFALVIAHRFKPIYVACLATRLPVVGIHHAFGGYDRPQRRWFAHLFRRRLSLLGVSDAVRDDIRKRLHGWAPERIETLHNRLDVESATAQLVSREEARTKLGLPDDATVIANVGRLHPDKDQATLLKGFAAALPNLPADSLLAIAGRGALEDDLRLLARNLGIADRVRFLGQVPDVRRFFPAFDLFVLSSDHEPFGMVLLEAMAAGVPILATDCGGAPEVLGSADQLFPLGNAKQLADMLTDFFTRQDAAFRQEIAEQGCQRLQKKFSDETARPLFFSLPMIQNVLSQTST
ncbi:glycosyltransferase [Propionivibrio limicola]|uniref:glycosyltransferase n=1 Tax=Propionivibrio limicola TaxID=167645 RepID=UPI001292A7E4|nr:glycosyltransferase [Propionivibrio limicola]